MSNQSELVRVSREPQAVAAAPFAGVNVEALLEKAVDSKAAVEVLERLMVMRREARAEAAKEAFDSSMAAFQAECPVITKTKFGYQNAYRFATLDQIVSKVRGLLKAHGFSYSITSEITEGWVKAVCKVTHALGHWEIAEFKAPIDANMKNLMSMPQRYGAAMTFGKRYAFCNAFGILTSDEDTDAGQKSPPPGPKRASENTRQWMVEGLKDMREKAIQYAIDRAWIMPDQGLEDWPLERVPTSKQGLAELRKAIEVHQ